MRAPFMALAAVCIAATASIIIVTKVSVDKSLVNGKQVSLKHEKRLLLKVPPDIAAKQLLQTVAPILNLKPFSKCDVAFIKPAQMQTAFITCITDTVIQFSQGTEIKVDPSDFVNERTGQAIAGAVKLQVKEFYAMEDILLNDLSTATKDGLLETNGMINIQAFAANGEACKLKKDGTIEIRFPKKNDKPGMELFSGAKKENGTIIWQPLLINASVVTSAPSQMALAKAEPVKIKVVDTTINSIPEFEGGLKGVERNINSVKNLFPVKNSNAMVIADFNVDINGYVCWVGKVAGNDDDYYNLLSEAFYKMPEWKPAVVKGSDKIMTMRMTVSFQVTNPRLMRFWSCVKSPDQNSNRSYNHIRDGFGNGSEYSGYSKNYVTQTLNYYAFTTSGLGWINCDRFYSSPNTMIDMYVAEPVEENTSIKLIFHNIRSVIDASVLNGKYTFGKLPKGEAVTLVALKGEKGNLKMAVKNMSISNVMINGLDFKNVTKEDVRNTMAQFNKLPGAVAKN